MIDEANPFLDITDRVYSDTELGMMGLAFHPNYVQNGRFFASFNCDKVKWPQCSGRCSCNSDVGCDPSKLEPDNGGQPCQYHSIIAEFTANATTPQPSSVNFCVIQAFFCVLYTRTFLIDTVLALDFSSLV